MEQARTVGELRRGWLVVLVRTQALDVAARRRRNEDVVYSQGCLPQGPGCGVSLMGAAPGRGSQGPAVDRVLHRFYRMSETTRET